GSQQIQGASACRDGRNNGYHAKYNVKLTRPPFAIAVTIQFLFHDLAIGRHVQIQFFQLFFRQQFHEIRFDLLQIYYFALAPYPVSIQHHSLVHIRLQAPALFR
ncbi:hypothetical protein, partial [Paenibacillus hubeiensis]|uniref:hypothetical protein n=1 Tax=Paenibacillus hubeiensis TaxID=3077330 RepID=UPI0031BA2CE2